MISERTHSQQRRPVRQQAAAAGARALAARVPRLVARHGAAGVPGLATRSTCAPRSASTPPGWAHFDYVKLPEYRWGIFLAEPTPDRRIGFGDFKGQPVWQEVPGEFRNQLRRLIVIAGRHRAGQRRAAAVARRALPEPVRPAQPVPGQRRGRPSSLGDGLPAALLLRPRRPRRGRGAARAPQRQRRHAAHARGVQRADRHLARLLRVHDVHRSRRQVAAAVALGELARSARRGRRGSC